MHKLFADTVSSKFMAKLDTVFR